MKCRHCKRSAARRRTLCAPCEARKDAYIVACYTAAIALGHCTVRGCKAARQPDRMRCPAHVTKQREASRRFDARQRERDVRAGDQRGGKPVPAKSIVAALDDFDSVL